MNKDPFFNGDTDVIDCLSNLGRYKETEDMIQAASDALYIRITREEYRRLKNRILELEGSLMRALDRGRGA